MSQYYSLTVDVYGYNPDKKWSIRDIIEETYPFRDVEFDLFTPMEDEDYKQWLDGEGRVTHACAAEQGNVSGPPEDMLKGLREAIWEHNGAYCKVDCTATFLEDLPYEEFTSDEEDYSKWRKGQNSD